MKLDGILNPTLQDLAATAVPAQRYGTQSRASFRARRMDPVSGRALECLAHAIEYLEDDRYACGLQEERAGAEQAIAMMKKLNREIFGALPELPERRSLLRLFMDRWERAHGILEEPAPSVH